MVLDSSLLCPQYRTHGPSPDPEQVVFLWEGRLQDLQGCLPEGEGAGEVWVCQQGCLSAAGAGACGETRAGEARDFELICQQTTEPSGSELFRALRIDRCTDPANSVSLVLESLYVAGRFL